MSTQAATLLDSPADIIRAALLAGNVGGFTDPSANPSPFPLYVNALPDSVEGVAACVYDTEGIKKGRLLSGGRNLFTYGFQVMVRHPSYVTGWTAAMAVQSFLESVRHLPVAIGANAYTLDTVQQSSPVLPTGQDEKRRQAFSYNGLLWLIGI